jgi:hypothetical protein
MQPRIEYLPATDDAGTPCELVRVTPFRRVSSLDGDSWMEQLPTVKTRDGEHCNPDGPGRYFAIHSGRRFTLTD